MEVSKEDFLSYRTVIFTNLPFILDSKKWPQANEQLKNFWDGEIEVLKVDLMTFYFFKRNYFEIGSMKFDWDGLKVEFFISKNQKDYLSIWSKLFLPAIKNECKNNLNIIEKMSSTPILTPNYNGCYLAVNWLVEQIGKWAAWS